MAIHIDGIEVLTLPKDDFAPKLSLFGYVQLALAFIAFWVLMHCFLHIALYYLVPLYREQVGREIHEYRGNAQSFIHAVTSVLLSIYCSFYAW